MMAKPDVLVLAPFYAPALAALEREFTLHKPWEARDAEAFVASVAPRVRAVVTTGVLGCTRAQMAKLAKLEMIACFGDGVEVLDLAAARERGIVVANTRQQITETVADLALALLLAVTRRIAECDRFVRAGRWPVDADRKSTRLNSSHVSESRMPSSA